MDRHGEVKPRFLACVQYPELFVGYQGIVENVRNIPNLIIVIYVHLADEFFCQVQGEADAVLVRIGAGGECVAGDLA